MADSVRGGRNRGNLRWPTRFPAARPRWAGLHAAASALRRTAVAPVQQLPIIPALDRLHGAPHALGSLVAPPRRRPLRRPGRRRHAARRLRGDRIRDAARRRGPAAVPDARLLPQRRPRLLPAVLRRPHDRFHAAGRGRGREGAPDEYLRATARRQPPGRRAATGHARERTRHPELLLEGPGHAAVHEGLRRRRELPRRGRRRRQRQGDRPHPIRGRARRHRRRPGRRSRAHPGAAQPARSPRLRRLPRQREDGCRGARRTEPGQRRRLAGRPCGPGAHRRRLRRGRQHARLPVDGERAVQADHQHRLPHPGQPAVLRLRRPELLRGQQPGARPGGAGSHRPGAAGRGDGGLRAPAGRHRRRVVLAPAQAAVAGVLPGAEARACLLRPHHPRPVRADRGAAAGRHDHPAEQHPRRGQVHRRCIERPQPGGALRVRRDCGHPDEARRHRAVAAGADHGADAADLVQGQGRHGDSGLPDATAGASIPRSSSSPTAATACCR